MLDLNSNVWSTLSHAYGDASDIPALLKRLQRMPTSDGTSEPWFSLWSALAHQGDVYSASFAAIPHVIAVAELNPSQISSSYFQFPAWVEICRVRKNISVQDDLAFAYRNALEKLPGVVASVPSTAWNSELIVCALAAIAASKGYYSIAAANLELSPDTANEFLEWVHNR